MPTKKAGPSEPAFLMRNAKSRLTRAGFPHAKCEFWGSLLSCLGSLSGLFGIVSGFFGCLDGFFSGFGGFFSYLFGGFGGFFSYLFGGFGGFARCLACCLSGLRSLMRRVIRSFGSFTGRIVGLLAAHHRTNDRED